jgi:hypothetical protein
MCGSRGGVADNGGKVAEYLADKIKVFIFVARNG